MMIMILLLLMIAMLSMFFMNSNDHQKMKKMSLLFSFLVLWSSVWLWVMEQSKTSYQSTQVLSWLSDNINTSWGPVLFGLDNMSFPFMLLTNLLIPICIIMSWNTINFLVSEFTICLLLIQILLTLVFTSLNLLTFYMSFEGMLMPMFLMMGMWGSRKEKESAAYYFFFFTLVGSLFMLRGLFALYNYHGTLDYQILFTSETPESLQIWVFLAFFLSLAVKMPKIPVHIWLPQAHVEAPVAGSVLLAGVLLKLGGYGFISFSWTLFPYAANYFSPFIILLSFIAMIYASLTTCRQIDTKKLVAYSSVAHMGLVVLGMFSKTYEGIIASVLLMVAHGFVSSGLFMSVTNLYDSFHTSVMRYYSGVVYTMPLFTSLFFLLTLSNMAFPITMNFMGEFLSILSMTQTTLLGLICPLLGMIMTGIYSLLLFNKVCFGNPSQYMLYPSDLTSSEFQAPLMVLLFTLALGFTPVLLNNNLMLPFIQ